MLDALFRSSSRRREPETLIPGGNWVWTPATQKNWNHTRENTKLHPL
jgi:hypothetical protein